MTDLKHILFIPGALWGHIRPVLAIVSNLLPIHPDLLITILLPAQFTSITTSELALFDLSPSCLSRLRLLRYGSENEGQILAEFGVIPKIMEDAIDNVKENLPRIMKGEPINDSVSGQMVESFNTDISTVYCDHLFITHLPQVLVDILTPGIKIANCSPMGPGYMDWYMLDQNDQSVFNDLYEDMDRGLSANEAYVKNLENNEALVKIPGSEQMYVYETVGNLSLEPWIPAYRDARRNMLEIVHGILANAPAYLSRENLSDWTFPDKPMFCVGPLLPPRTQPVPDEILEWLNTAKSDCGEKTVAYISFGSLFFAPTATQIPLLITALANREKPSLLVPGNCSSEIGELLRKTVKEKGKNLVKILKWAPQQAILQHPAVGWFLTHAGQGAVNESISAGVPMVFWPMALDQVFLANQLSRIERVGIELIQTRSGCSIGRRTFRGAVVLGTDDAIAGELNEAFMAMDGEEGQKMRNEVARVRREFEKDAKEGGRTWSALHAVGSF